MTSANHLDPDLAAEIYVLGSPAVNAQAAGSVSPRPPFTGAPLSGSPD